MGLNQSVKVILPNTLFDDIFDMELALVGLLIGWFWDEINNIRFLHKE